MFGDVFHSSHCLLQICIPLNSHMPPEVWKPTTLIWDVASLPAELLCQVLINIERVGVSSDPAQPDIGVLPLLCASVGILFLNGTLVATLSAEFLADVGRARTPHEEEGGKAD